MDYDLIYVDDERNAVRVSDHRRPGGTTRPGYRPRPARTVVVPPGARPTVITGGSSQAGYYRPVAYPQQPYFGGESFASRFGMTTGELIDMGIQALAAIQSLPAAPVAQGEAGVDVENLITYQGALWQHAKRDEQLRTLGGLLARILK
ncbi:MAG: hypothetical protein SFX73_17795 [Kofleriaceae bacterium]|nr:hypothetical protein [Kofleriaceae bacterium]